MMSLTIKKTALAAAIGLTISASPVGAFPFWNFTPPPPPPPGESPFGSGALGGDNQYAPFNGRYLLESGTIEFETEDVLFETSDLEQGGYYGAAPLSTPTVIGTLKLFMELKGRAYDFPDAFPGRPEVAIIDPDGQSGNGDEYIELGDFTFEMTYYNVLYGQDGVDYLSNEEEFEDFVMVAAPSLGSFGEGTLTYDTDIVSGDQDISIDGEMQGDVVKFRTPDCAELEAKPGRSSVMCGDSFFQMVIPRDGSEAEVFTPSLFYGEFTSIDIPGVDGSFDVGIAFDGPFGAPILRSDNIISLFHAGLPCPPPGEYDGGTAEAFYCDPIAANFPFDGIPYLVGGEPVFDEDINPLLDEDEINEQLFYETYAEYIGGFNPPGRFAFIDALATPANVPSPATGLLFGAGLAGLGFARRRAKARSGK